MFGVRISAWEHQWSGLFINRTVARSTFPSLSLVARGYELAGRLLNIPPCKLEHSFRQLKFSIPKFPFCSLVACHTKALFFTTSHRISRNAFASCNRFQYHPQAFHQGHLERPLHAECVLNLPPRRPR